MNIDITKPVRTKDGRAVRDLVKVGETHLAGFVGDLKCPDLWDTYGNYCNVGPSAHLYQVNIENVPEPRVVWVNVNDLSAWAYSTRKEADRSAAPHRKCLVELDLTNHTAKWHKVGGEG